ncbi:MAG: Band 7 protein [Alteromonadaceae bacterium]|nr:Band 7 protein [Alteromonadaceae bacterium]
MKTNLLRMTKLAIVLLAVATLAGCSLFGEKVTIPPANVGKVLTKDGFKTDTYGPSRFRLDPCMFYCDRLITLETSDQPKVEKFALFMPRDQLNMGFDLRMTVSIDERKVDDIYNKVPSERSKISFERVYMTYGQPIIRDVARQIMAEYSINEVASSRERLSAQLQNEIAKALVDTPLKLKRLGLADVQFPEIITKAKEQAAERREQIEREKAQFEIQKIQQERELAQAKMQRAIDREKAEATKEVNEILSKSVTDKYLSYRSLEVLEKMAASGNKVFVPVEALGTLGLQQAVFSEQLKKTAGK